ncbi:protease inhibitor I42 family protein [Phenylobacterium sp.]|uniref:protease inhibitor I42 family protein n=1 Tax=Phenylobacterium sp. TaxID=1871053 RepID=UPI0011F439AF|nr:protease inhibitor I42 family protein [Phenylobacterium sp.]THD61609.1 MAG: ImmA/IrrE family metallo-endopeptidase [Phenylobacterium sp.]
MTEGASNIRRAVLEATRLHRDLAIQARVIRGEGRVDVYDTIARLGVPLFFTHLDGLLGAYYRKPAAGILVTTERQQSLQRFTAAHELGHHYLGHSPSLDDEAGALRRQPFFAKRDEDLQEVEAETFAAAFLLPRWLLDWHCERQSWTDQDLLDPVRVYQLSLRVGMSFTATVWTLFRYDVFDLSVARAMADVAPKKIKQTILRGYAPTSYRGDVWLLTERDADLRVEGGPEDLIVVRLEEQSGAGYMWRVESIDGRSLAVVSDGRQGDPTDEVGGPTLRQITTEARRRGLGELRLAETRPWQPAQPRQTFAITYNLAGAERQGWYSRQRQSHFESLRAA